MKKKIILVVSLMFVICAIAISFSGCFILTSRHETLKLSGVYQMPDETIVVDIKNDEEIKDNDTLEISFDDGNTWKKAGSKWIGKRNIARNFIRIYSYKINELEYGETYKIAVRIAKDRDNRASKKSNVIEYQLKMPNDFDYESVAGQWSLNNIFDSTKPQYKDEYIFVCEDNKLILKKYYQEQSGEINLKAVEDDDKIDIEYKFLNRSAILEEMNDYMRSIDGMDSFRDSFQSDGEYLDFMEGAAFGICHQMHCSDESYIADGWRDYDYSKGIPKEEYSANVVADFRLDKESEQFTFSGKQAILLVRAKASDSMIMSETFVIAVPLNKR